MYVVAASLCVEDQRIVLYNKLTGLPPAQLRVCRSCKSICSTGISIHNVSSTICTECGSFRSVGTSKYYVLITVLWSGTVLVTYLAKEKPKGRISRLDPHFSSLLALHVSIGMGYSELPCMALEWLCLFSTIFLVFRTSWGHLFNDDPSTSCFCTVPTLHNSHLFLRGGFSCRKDFATCGFIPSSR